MEWGRQLVTCGLADIRWVELFEWSDAAVTQFLTACCVVVSGGHRSLRFPRGRALTISRCLIGRLIEQLF